MRDSCPVCGSVEYAIAGIPRKNTIASEFIDEEYYVVKCNRCDVYYISPRIQFTDAQWEKLYNSEYFSLQSKWLIRKREKELQQRFNTAEALFKNNSDIKFLDVGSGEGKTLIAGRKRDWEVTGIDIVDNRIEEAKVSPINFIQDKFTEYHFPENYFDFIYLDSVLEHVLNPLGYLEKIKRILKHSGIVYIGVPNEDSLFNDIKRLAYKLSGRKELSEKLKPFVSPYHIVGFNSRSLKNIIAKTGLKIIYFRNFGRKLQFLGSPVSSRGFWIDLTFLFPVEIIGNIINRDVYFETYVTKK